MNWLPRISVITPSFNQAKFLEQTIRSVLDQGYPNLQYGIVDGQSTDGSIDIIRRYQDKLDFAIIEKDRGQTEAINKGLRRADGDIVCWLCSDDTLLPNALKTVGSYFANNPKAHWLIGACNQVEVDGRLSKVIYPSPITSLEGVLFRDQQHPFVVPQPSVFWKRSINHRVGFLREDLHYCMDFEFWLRLVRHGWYPHLLDAKLATYRLHEASKTCATPDQFVREHVMVEGEYACLLPWHKRAQAWRRRGYMKRAYSIRADVDHPWRLIFRRPWWILSDQVRQAIKHAA